MNKLQFYTNLSKYRRNTEIMHSSCYYENLGKMKHKILTVMKKDFKKSIPEDATEEEIEAAWKKFKKDNYDSYYEDYKEDKIEHAGTVNYKYYAKEDLGNGKSRYYYSRDEWEAAHKNSGSAADKAAEEAARRNAIKEQNLNYIKNRDAAKAIEAAKTNTETNNQKDFEEALKKQEELRKEMKEWKTKHDEEIKQNLFNEALKKQDELREKMKDWKSKHDEEIKEQDEKETLKQFVEEQFNKYNKEIRQDKNVQEMIEKYYNALNDKIDDTKELYNKAKSLEEYIDKKYGGKVDKMVLNNIKKSLTEEVNELTKNILEKINTYNRPPKFIVKLFTGMIDLFTKDDPVAEYVGNAYYGASSLAKHAYAIKKTLQ